MLDYRSVFSPEVVVKHLRSFLFENPDNYYSCVSEVDTFKKLRIIMKLNPYIEEKGRSPSGDGFFTLTRGRIDIEIYFDRPNCHILVTDEYT